MTTAEWQRQEAERIKREGEEFRIAKAKAKAKALNPENINEKQETAEATDKKIKKVGATIAGAVNTTAPSVMNTLGSTTFNRGDSAQASAQRAAAELSGQQATRAQVEAQEAKQIGNRDQRVEASKDAAASAAAQFQQQVGQMSGAQGAASAALGAMRTVDPTQTMGTHMQRADSQRMVGIQRADTADRAAANRIAQEARADELNRVDRDQMVQDNQMRNLTTPLESTLKTVPGGPTPAAMQEVVDRVPASIQQQLVEFSTPQLQEAVNSQFRSTIAVELLNRGLSKEDIMSEVTRRNDLSDRRAKRIINIANRRF